MLISEGGIILIPSALEFLPDRFEVKHLSGLHGRVDCQGDDGTFQPFVAAAFGSFALEHGFKQAFHDDDITTAVGIGGPELPSLIVARLQVSFGTISA